MVLDLKPALVSSQYDISLIPNILQLRILSICEHSPIPNITLRDIGQLGHAYNIILEEARTKIVFINFEHHEYRTIMY